MSDQQEAVPEPRCRCGRDIHADFRVAGMRHYGLDGATGLHEFAPATDDEADVPAPEPRCNCHLHGDWIGPWECPNHGTVQPKAILPTDGECDLCADEGPLFRWYAQNAEPVAMCEDCHGKCFAWLWDQADARARVAAAIDAAWEPFARTADPARVGMYSTAWAHAKRAAVEAAAIPPAPEARS